MRISIVTPSFNQARFIRRTIDSVLSQRGDFELEYLIVDGASTDGTRDLLRTYGDRVRWISEPDQGQVEALNKGFQRTTGEIVGWLNSDDLLLPGALQRIASWFRDHPSCQWLHGGCRIIDVNDVEIRRWISAYKRYCSRRYSRRRLLTDNFISQMTVYWRRELMLQAGGLDAQLALAFDYDYWLRLSTICDPDYLDASVAAFRWYETSKSGRDFQAQCLEDNLVARRYATGARYHVFEKRMHLLVRVWAYRTMSRADRRLGQR